MKEKQFFPVQKERNGGSSCGVVANVLDCDIKVSEFKLQLC